MKSNLSKYVLGFGLVGILITGGCVPTPEEQSEAGDTVITVTDDLYVAFDVDLYSKDAAAIVVGTVKEVGEPYVRDNRGISQQDVSLDVTKVLKGELDMTRMTVVLEGGFPVATDENGEQSIADEDTPDSFVKSITSDEPAMFTSGENVLLFLWKNAYGEFDVYGGPNGKFTIDQNNMAISIDGSSRPLEEFEAEIQSALAKPSSL